MSERAGYDAALRGRALSSCPWSPSDPDGAGWRRGWVTGEADRRLLAGTFDHTPAEYAAYKRSIGWHDDTEDAGDDPARWGSNVPQFQDVTRRCVAAWFTISFDPDAVQTRITELLDFSRQLLDLFEIPDTVAVELQDLARAIATRDLELRNLITINPAT